MKTIRFRLRRLSGTRISPLHSPCSTATSSPDKCYGWLDGDVCSADQTPSETETRVVLPLTPSLLQTSMDEAAAGIQPWDEGRFTVVRQLQAAERNFGCVELMSTGGRHVAVKRMPTDWIRRSSSDFDARYPESSERPWVDVGTVKHLNEVGFAFCVKLLSIFADGQDMYVVSSLASEGDLFAWCESAPELGPEREAAMHPLARQIFAGVGWLHDLGVAHRDLSLENLLIHSESGEQRIKIIDFGMSTQSRSTTAEVRGKPAYQAPEVHRAQPIDTFLADAFSLGVVLFAMSARAYPWNATRPKACDRFEYFGAFGLPKLLKQLPAATGRDENLAQTLSPSLTSLLEGLLDTCPGKRLTLGEACFGAAGSGGRPRRATVWDCAWTARAAV